MRLQPVHRLILQAGVPTELHAYPGTPHGFEFLAPEATISRRFERDMTEALRAALRSPAGDSV